MHTIELKSPLWNDLDDCLPLGEFHQRKTKFSGTKGKALNIRITYTALLIALSASFCHQGPYVTHE